MRDHTYSETEVYTFCHRKSNWCKFAWRKKKKSKAVQCKAENQPKRGSRSTNISTVATSLETNVPWPGNNVFSNYCNGCGFSFSSNNKLREAIYQFHSDAITTVYKYGNMNCWDIQTWVLFMSIMPWMILFNWYDINVWICYTVQWITGTVISKRMFHQAKNFN